MPLEQDQHVLLENEYFGLKGSETTLRREGQRQLKAS